jgi:hypothetical protein
MPRPKMLSSSESIAPTGCAAAGGSTVGPANVPARKRDSAITFLLPSCFLKLSGFRFNPLGDRPNPIPWVQQSLFLRDGVVLCLPSGPI